MRDFIVYRQTAGMELSCHAQHNGLLWKVLISHVAHWACSEAKKSSTILKISL